MAHNIYEWRMVRLKLKFRGLTTPFGVKYDLSARRKERNEISIEERKPQGMKLG